MECELMVFNIENTGFELNRRNIMYNGKIMISLGEGSYIDGAEVNFGDEECLVAVGKYTSIGRDVRFIVGLNHDYRKISSYPFTTIKKILNGEKNVNPGDVEGNEKDIIIGSDVWIGTGVTIMGGVRIGDGAIIGAGAVVAKNIPPYAVAVGNPVKIIKYRFENKAIDMLEEIKWWNRGAEWVEKNICLLEGNNIRDIYECLDEKRMMSDFGCLKKEGYRIFYVIPNEKTGKKFFKKCIDYIKDINKGGGSVLIVANNVNNNKDGWLNDLLDFIDDDSVIITLYDYNKRKDIINYVDEYIFLKDDISLDMLDYFDYKSDVIYYNNINNNIENKPVLTIGIPTYNRLYYLKKSLHYICEAVGNDDRVEIFVADNCSTRNVQEFMLQENAKFSNIKYVRHEKNKGAIFNYEYLRREAKGKFVWIVGDDDYYKPEAIKAALKALSYKQDWSVLCLLNNNSEYKVYNELGIDSFVRNVSFAATAISAWIVKTESLKCDCKKDKCRNSMIKDSLIPQLVLVLDVLNNNANYGVLLGKLYEPNNGESVYTTPEQFVEMGKKSGLPDLGTVFIHEYFKIIESYKDCGITDETIKLDLERVLNGMIIPWCKLISERRVRWQAKHVLKWYDIYYKQEEYYAVKRKELEEILSDIDATIVEDHTDLGRQFD